MSFQKAIAPVDWVIETMNNPRYPLELFLRIITVSRHTQAIVNRLPELSIQAGAADPSSWLHTKDLAANG